MFLAGETTRFVAVTVGIDKNTAWTIRKQAKEKMGVIICACGKPAGHKGWCGARLARSPNRIRSLLSQLRNITSFNIYVPSRPQYERPDIENERETEVPLLVNRKFIRSLDAPVYDGEDNGHSFFSSGHLTPLEELIQKEELQSEEAIQRRRRIEDFEHFEKCHTFFNLENIVEFPAV